MSIFKKIVESYGYIPSQKVNEIVEVAPELEVVIKSYEHGRPIVPIKDLNCTLESINYDVREVFVNADTYDIMFDL